MLETELVVEGFADKICLSYTSPAIDCTKLRLLVFKKTQQFPLFFFTSYYH